eukprot:14558209-Ditylum_brightwellii.AAC.1
MEFSGGDRQSCSCPSALKWWLDKLLLESGLQWKGKKKSTMYEHLVLESMENFPDLIINIGRQFFAERRCDAGSQGRPGANIGDVHISSALISSLFRSCSIQGWLVPPVPMTKYSQSGHLVYWNIKLP